MSRKYEGLIVLNTHGVEDSVNDLVSAVAKEMEAEGAKMEEIQQLGRKKFAYNARHLEGGQYVSYIFDAEPASIDKIQTKLKLNDLVFLQHYRTQG
ncbi:30S ribosomal protein S6 [Persicirhabdus sediminis]|uniref:Small ribosomal subunit protein bS6 n=1 Tax=Persicirhabdus sediminis TaxID=454144 RepID=A0A8J7MGZ8_9BACT|nr:30S ribosomal protein S6 [Persicirhabdus sediminis]MBK1792752.1 30S ribosomal protein S6 [Persicirhabdus sediminis]